MTGNAYVQPAQPRTYIRIIIDDEDREQEPGRPYTLNVHTGGDGGSPDWLLELANPADQAIVGASIPALLRVLADAWERAADAELNPREAFT